VGVAGPRNTSHPHFYHREFGRFTSNAMDTGRGAPKLGTAEAPLLWRHGTLTINQSINQVYYFSSTLQARFHISFRYFYIRSLAYWLIMPNLTAHVWRSTGKWDTPVQLFKVTRDHPKWHGSIRCLWLPINPIPLSYHFRNIQ